MKAIVLAILLFCNLEGREVENIIHSIPSRERKKIEELFAHFVQYDSLGFVLFGKTKPVAFCTIPLSCDYTIFPTVAFPLKYQNHLKQNWMIWTQYRHKFMHPNIIICEEYDFLSQRLFLQLFFIDKKKLQYLLDEYHSEFAQVLGENFSAAKFIVQIEKKKKLRPFLKNDEKLLGILLGFGSESSNAFRNFLDSNDAADPLDVFGQRPPGCLITPVSFKGYHRSKQAQTLIEIDNKEIQEIEEIFKSDAFLVKTFEKFCAS